MGDGGQERLGEPCKPHLLPEAAQQPQQYRRAAPDAADRPCSRLGFPTPKRVLISKARLSPATWTRSRLAMFSWWRR